MPAERALVGIDLACERVVVVGKKSLAGGNVDAALMLGHETLPTQAPRAGTLARIAGEGGLFPGQLGVHGEVRPGEIAVLLPPQVHVLQSQFEAGDFVGVAVGDEPIVGVTAIVAFPHNAGERVDGRGVLHGLARAHKLRNPLRIEAVELCDGGLGDHQAGGVHAEVVAAVDEARVAVHQDAMATRGNYVENDVPEAAIEVTAPVVVGDYGTPIRGVGAGCDKSAAAVGRRAAPRWPIEPRKIIARYLHHGVHGDDVPQIQIHPARLEAVRDALHLFTVFLFDARPENLFGGLANEAVGLAAIVSHAETDALVRLPDFGRQKISVLKSDGGRAALQVHENPAIVWRPSQRLRETRVGIRRTPQKHKTAERHQRENPSHSFHSEASYEISHYKLKRGTATEARAS